MKRALLAVGGFDRAAALLPVVKQLEPDSLILVHVQESGKRTRKRGRLCRFRMFNEPVQSALRREAADRETEDMLTFCRKELENGPVTVAMQVREGDPGQEILRAAREEDVDLIVLGGNASRLHRLLPGSIAADVERNANVPVLVCNTSGTKKSHTDNWRGEVYVA